MKVCDGERAQFLDIDVGGLAGSGRLQATDRLFGRPVQISQPTHAVADEDPMHP